MLITNNTNSAQIIKLVDNHKRSEWKNSVWDLLDTAYRNVAGGLHFASPDAMLDEAQEWEILHDSGQILAALLYKHKHGRKIIAFGVTEQEWRRHEVISTLGEIIRHRLTDAWIEVSERAESFVLRNGGDHRRIPNRYASQLTGKSILSLKDDGFHYVREICGIHKQKLIVGTPRLSLRQNNRMEKHENWIGRKSFQCIASCH